MIDNYLNTFLTVCECGSFNKAAEKLFLSSTAVIKQMNELEQSTGLTLFQRTHRGIALTASGRSFLNDVRYLTDAYEQAKSRAMKIEQDQKNTIRLGVSPLSKGEGIIRAWDQIARAEPDLKLKLVPFNNNMKEYEHGMRTYGETIDIIEGFFNQHVLDLYGAGGTITAHIPIRLCLSRSDPLSEKKIIHIHEDLKGHTLCVPLAGVFSDFDGARAVFSQLPDTAVEDLTFFDTELFNHVANDHVIAIGLDPWVGVHPGVVIAAADWDLTCTWGIMHAVHPSEAVERFLHAYLKTAKNETV